VAKQITEDINLQPLFFNSRPFLPEDVCRAATKGNLHQKPMQKQYPDRECQLDMNGECIMDDQETTQAVSRA
jgi:hypothetical protein